MKPEFPREDLYKILGVDSECKEQEIKDAYKKLVLVHHTDKGGEAEEFKKIKDAYKILTEWRGDYDQEIHFKYFYSTGFETVYGVSESPLPTSSSTVSAAKAKVWAPSSSSSKSTSGAMVAYQRAQEFTSISSKAVNEASKEQLAVVIFQAQEAVEKSLSVRTPDNMQNDKLRKLVSQGNVTKLQEYIEHNKFTDSDTLKFFVLQAAEEGNLEICKLLIETFHTDYSKFAIPPYGEMSCLKAACISSNIALVEYFLNINKEWGKTLRSGEPGDSYGSALNFAVRNGKLEVVKFLVKYGMKLQPPMMTIRPVPIDENISKLGSDAIASGSLDMVKYMQEQGVFKEQTYELGEAIKNGHLEVLQYLLTFEPKLDHNKLYEHPASLAIQSGSVKMLKYLQDRYSISLHLDFICGQRVLKKKGAEQYMNYALEKGNIEMLDHLINKEKLLESSRWHEILEGRNACIRKIEDMLFQKITETQHPSGEAMLLFKTLLELSDRERHFYSSSRECGIQINALLCSLLNNVQHIVSQERRLEIGNLLCKLAIEGLTGLSIAELCTIFAHNLVRTANGKDFIAEVVAELRTRKLPDHEFMELVKLSDDFAKTAMLAYFCSQHSGNDVNKLRILLKSGVSPNTKLPDCQSPCTAVIGGGTIYIAKLVLLLENGADVTQSLGFGISSLDLLAPYPEYIEYLVSTNRNDLKDVACHYLCSLDAEKYKSEILKLLKSGANPNFQRNGESNLINAIKYARQKVKNTPSLATPFDTGYVRSNTELFLGKSDFQGSVVYALLQYGATLPVYDHLSPMDKGYLDMLMNDHFFKENPPVLHSPSPTTTSSAYSGASSTSAYNAQTYGVNGATITTKNRDQIETLDKHVNLGGKVSSDQLGSLSYAYSNAFMEKVDATQYDSAQSDFGDDDLEDKEKEMLHLQIESLISFPYKSVAILKVGNRLEKMVFASENILAHTPLCFVSGTFINNKSPETGILIGRGLIDNYFQMDQHHGLASYFPHLPNEKKFDDVKAMSVALREATGKSPSQNALKLSNELYSIDFYGEYSAASVATANIYLERVVYKGMPLILLVTKRDVAAGELLGFDYGVDYLFKNKCLPPLYDKLGKEIPTSAYTRNFYRLTFQEFSVTCELGILIERLRSNGSNVEVKSDQNTTLSLNPGQVLDELKRVNGVSPSRYDSLMKSYFKQKYQLEDVTKNDMDSCLLKAAQQKDLDDVKRLVQFVGNINVTDKSNGRTAMHYAAISGDRKMYLYLITKAPEGSHKIPDNTGKTAVEYFKENYAALQDSQLLMSSILQSSQSF